MGRRSEGIRLVVVAGLVLGMAAPLWAEEIATPRANAALRKLGRGIANIATCPFELLRTPALVGQQEGYIAASSVGILQGAWRTILRGVVGVFEVGTFYAEIPKDYGPLMKPEFVWAHGNWAE